MRTALRIIFSRYGIVVIILVLVLLVIALAQSREDFPLGQNRAEVETSSPSAPQDELTADDGIATFDCDEVDCEDSGSPLHDPYEEEDLPAEAVDRALEFTAAFLNTEGATSDTWHQGIAPYLTTERAEVMQGVDPSSIPASTITGDEVAEGSKVSIPLDTGTLTLTMVEGGNSWVQQAWLVSAIDWESE